MIYESKIRKHTLILHVRGCNQIYMDSGKTRQAIKDFNLLKKFHILIIHYAFSKSHVSCLCVQIEAFYSGSQQFLESGGSRKRAFLNRSTERKHREKKMVGGFQSRFYTRRDNIMASNGSKKHQKKQTPDIDQLRRLLPGMNSNKSEVNFD